MLWFTGNGVKDHLTSMESSVEEDKRPQLRLSVANLGSPLGAGTLVI